MARLYQGAFSAGEMAPGIWGRVDLERYKAGLRVARNMFPLPEGGIMKRPGLEFVGFSPEGRAGEGWLIPFKFNTEQTYMLLAQPNSISFVKNGGFILRDMDTPAAGGPIAGTPTVSLVSTIVTVNWTSHTYADGDILFWNVGGYDELEGRWFEVSSKAANTFELTDYVTQQAVIGSSYSTNATAIDFGQIFTLGMSDGWYTGVETDELDYSGANDVLYISHPDAKTKILARGATDLDWTLTDFDPAPTTATPTNLADTSTTAPSGVTEVDYAVTAVDNTTREESIAAQITISGIDDDAITDSASIQLSWDHMSGSDKYYIYKATAGLFGIIGKASGTSGTIVWDDVGAVANLAIAPPLEVAPEFDASDQYPGVVEFFQQRAWFGRTNENLRDFYASRAGSVFSFANSTVTTEADPIEQAIVAKSLQEVKHFIPLRDLVIMTTDAEWGFDTGDAGAVTPSAGLIAHSFWGSSKVKPVLVGESAIFVDKSERTVRDLAYALQNDGFASSDISIFAKHLFQGRTVVSMCFAQTPFRTLFCVMSDGRAISCTYVADQQIFAWAHHDTGGRFLSCASVEEDGRDNIYVYVERAYTTAIPYRQVERMQMINPQFVEQGIWLDNAMDVSKPTSTNKDGTVLYPRIVADKLSLLFLTATPADGAHVRVSFNFGTAVEPLDGISLLLEEYDTNSFYPKRSINGSTSVEEYFDWERFVPDNLLDAQVVGYYKNASDSAARLHHLSYRSGLVDVRADHMMYADQTVAIGGRHTIAAEAAVVHFGEDYISEFETLDIDDAADPITGLPLSVRELEIRFGMGVRAFYGRRRDHLVSIDLTNNTVDEEFDMTLGFYRGVYGGLVFPGWRRDGRLVVRSRDGFPFTVLAVIPVLDAGGIDA